MEELAEQIRTIRQKNFERRGCVPAEGLYQLLPKETIRRILEDSVIDVFDLDETTQAIFHGARKTFAILVTLGKPDFILNFIAHDQYQEAVLDNKLPRFEATLQSIIPKLAKDFYERQWEYLVPTLYRSTFHRLLDPETILPFADNDKIGEGGFGIVYETTLLDGKKIARKEFKATTSSLGSPEVEHRNLALLSHLKHPNLVELLNFYTFRNQHNFLFPLASHGDLAGLLSSEKRPAELESEECIYIALSGLASALEKTHNFTSRTLKLDLIGCHHDFRPNNILVDGDRFILADFGLSRFKDQAESSKTLFKIGMGHYLAPECQDEEDLKESIISRPSDIWSFGCILTEFLTHILDGRDGVALYKQERKVKEKYGTTYHFHSKASDPVRGWLLDLEPRLSHTGKKLLQLAKDMMALQPADRPVAAEITRRLRYIALEAVYLSAKPTFNALLRDSSNLEAVIELGRFIAWGWALQEMQTGRYENIPVSDHSFESVRKILFEIREEIVSILPQLSHMKSRLFLPLQLLNDELMHFLPSRLEDLVRKQLELWMVGTDNADTLKMTREAFYNSFPYRRIGLLAAIKHVSILSNNHKELSRPDLNLQNTVRCESHHDNYSLGYIQMMQLPAEEIRTRVLVEWKEYNTYYVGEVGKELFIRVEALAELLNSAGESSGLRTLHCNGYFQDPLRHSFGFVYNFPANTNSASKPLTLAQILTDTKNIRTRPVLEDRFKLAHQISAAVLEFHEVGWLHKNLTAQNIIFFHDPSHRSISVHKPYIIGFNHSRPNEASAFSEGPNQNPAIFDYQHPEYLTNRQRFRPEFDYYSLGLILLEIGIWMPLSDVISKLEPFDRSRYKPNQLQQAIHQAIVKERVSVLGQYMGTTYCNVVRACLAGNFGASKGGIDSSGVELFVGANFARLVIEPLESCCL